MGSSYPPPDEERRAFLVIRHGSGTHVSDLPVSDSITIGRGDACTITVEDADVADIHLRIAWDGKRVALEAPEERTFVNGKRAEQAAELKPGDEITIGRVRLALGIAIPPTAGGRRALTHHEFRERLWEELARASRGGRETSLVMVLAHTGEGGHVAQTALETFRAGDVVGTYAHDELEIILPDTPGDVARRVVDRVFRAANVQALAGLAVAPADGDNPERLLRSARSALARAREEGAGVAPPPPKPRGRVEPMTRDAATRQLVAELTEIAGGDSALLLTGELSSGKGVFARLVHERSARKNGPFVIVLCASLGEEEAEEAFAGDASVAARARGGTLFLDEVTDLSTRAQARLLDAIERHDGGLRLIASTQRTLAGLVERGAFHPRLYELFAQEVVEVPSLRNRPEDIIPLAERFAERFGAPSPVDLSPGAIARLRSYPWPGNVLELCNAMERAVRLANGAEILAEHLPSETLPVAKAEGGLREHVDSVERDAIIKALADSNHNQTHAARRLGISRRALIYKMEKYGLKRPPGARK